MSTKMEYVSKNLIKQHGAELREALRKPDAKIDDIANMIEAMGAEDRIHAVRFLGGKDQKKLWELCEGRKVTNEHMVPEGTPKGKMVRHHGKNSLPAFSLFEKRFCLPTEGEAKELWGFNFQNLTKITGPGYFVAYEDKETDSLAIDYRRLPPKAPEGCPPLKPNEAGLSKFIYKGMIDYMRLVSDSVTIGRAFKNDKWQPNYFVLCREPL
ncbi:MAG: hypothetical protein P1V97_11710 [Planctomycetota bacterium]|nr:hypothetical protein [Planctomycetota bacterium]